MFPFQSLETHLCRVYTQPAARLHVACMKAKLRQEHGCRDLLEVADGARVVHEKSFVDKFGPVDDAIRNIALILHGAQYIKIPLLCEMA